MLRRQIVIGAIALVLMVGRIVSAQEPPVRPCQSEDVVGTWTLVSLKPNIPPRSDDPDFFPHQLWTFTASGTMRIMKRATPFKADELGKFIHVSSHEPSMTTSYQVYAERAALVMSPQGAPSPYLFSCLVVAQAHEAAGLKPGDLLLDLRTADGREIVLGHHLRKLQ